MSLRPSTVCFRGTRPRFDRSICCRRGAERPGLDLALGKLESLIKSNMCKKLK